MKGLLSEFLFFLFFFTAGGEVGESSGSRSILPRAGSIMFCISWAMVILITLLF